MADVTFVYASTGDWVAMYIDGQLSVEGHSLPTSDIFTDLVGEKIDSFKEFEGNDWTGGGRGYESLSEYTGLCPW